MTDRKYVPALRDLGALDVARSIADKHRVTVDAILSRSRYKYACRARHELWAILKWTLDLSLNVIGAIFDRNHTTILVGIRKYESEMLKMIREYEAERNRIAAASMGPPTVST